MKQKAVLILIGLMLMVSAVACKHGSSPQQNLTERNSAVQVEGQ